MTAMRRRTLLTFALAAFPLAALPTAGRAHFPGKRSRRTTTQSDGGQHLTAFVYTPEAVPAPAVMVVHGQDGLGAGLRSLNAELGRKGFMAAAPHLAEEAILADAARTQDALTSWMRWLKAHFSSNGRLAVMGFGEGGAWAARACLAEPAHGLVCFCPPLADPALAEAAARLPLLLHLSTPAQSAAAKLAPSRAESHWYSAGAGFADVLSADYDREADSLASGRTFDFLKRSLR